MYEDSSDIGKSTSLSRQMSNLGKATCIAGCPPDEFLQLVSFLGTQSMTGGAMDKDGYKWWIERFCVKAKIYGYRSYRLLRGSNLTGKSLADTSTLVRGERSWLQAFAAVEAAHEKRTKTRCLVVTATIPI